MTRRSNKDPMLSRIDDILLDNVVNLNRTGIRHALEDATNGAEVLFVETTAIDPTTAAMQAARAARDAVAPRLGGILAARIEAEGGLWGQKGGAQ